MIKVLAIGSDRSVLQKDSSSAARQIAYGKGLGALDVIVFSCEGSRAPVSLSERVHVYPTASRSRLLYGVDAIHIARLLTKPDVITAQDPFEAGLVALTIARLLRVPLHVQVHTDLYAPTFRAHSFVNRIRLLLANIVLRRASRIRVVSLRIKSSLESRISNLAPISVLPIFVDIARFKNTQPGSLVERFAAFKWKVLIVARLEPEKNISLAIESFKHAAPKDACLIIVGDGLERIRLEQRKTERIFFEGAHDPAPYYTLANLVLVPSKYEGYGLTIIEALAAGKPVIATDVGSAREAGAIVTTEDQFTTTLGTWFVDGPRSGRLTSEAYLSFDDYVARYVADIVACTAN